MGIRTVQDALDMMRIILGRTNQNDPQASDSVMLKYFNDFVSLSSNNDVKLFEQYGTLAFTIDESTTDGVYTFNEVGASDQFINISIDAFISLNAPVNNSVSWNRLRVYQDPSVFYQTWGINNTEILVRGWPTEMLYYGNQFVFRTLPNDTYLVNIYGYKKLEDYPSADTDLDYDYYLRYYAYGASVNYARDYRYDENARRMIEASFKSERKLQLAHVHNQRKQSRALPRF